MNVLASRVTVRPDSASVRWRPLSTPAALFCDETETEDEHETGRDEIRSTVVLRNCLWPHPRIGRANSRFKLGYLRGLGPTGSDQCPHEHHWRKSGLRPQSLDRRRIHIYCWIVTAKYPTRAERSD